MMPYRASACWPSCQQHPKFSMEAAAALLQFVHALPWVSKTIIMLSITLHAGAQAGTYSVTLMVTDWLGQTDSTTWSFTKAAAALPLVQLVGGAQQSFTISQGIAVPAQIFLASVCAGAAQSTTRPNIPYPWLMRTETARM